MPAVNELAPNMDVAEWAQGEPSNIDKERGRVILIEAFQVNCPGCFLFAFPEVIALYEEFREKGLVVWGLATAFEDFHLNNLENLRRLLDKGETVGETERRLAFENRLPEGRLEYKIPFPVAWDKVVPNNGENCEAMARELVGRDFPDFEQLPERQRSMIRQQVEVYLKNKPYNALTFDKYHLRGTPSTLLIDKKGLLRQKWFGSGHDLRASVESLLIES